jgi:hypothetical protein
LDDNSTNKTLLPERIFLPRAKIVAGPQGPFGTSQNTLTPQEAPDRDWTARQILVLIALMTEGLLWGLIPAVAAAFTIIVSLCAAVSVRRRIQYFLSTIVIAIAAWSLLLLYRIFILGAWPTFLPHIAIAICVVTSFVQVAFARGGNAKSKRRTDF